MSEPEPRRYKHVHQFKDRHGNMRIYFRPPGMHATTLRGPLGSLEFMDDFDTALQRYLDVIAGNGLSPQLSVAAERRLKNTNLAIWGSREPPRCGVYFLMAGDIVVYIGSSTDIKSRVLKHRQNGRPFDGAYALEAPEGKHKDLERMFIMKIKPKQNRTLLGM